MTERIMHYVPVDIIYRFMRDFFVKVGTPEDDAAICADVMIASDLRGIESHGIGRLRYYYDRIISGQHDVKTPMQVVRDGATTAVIDGNHGLGMVISKRAMQMAIEKARVHGMASVAVRNSTHFGIAGYYPMMAVEQGMIGLTVTNSRPSMSPTFGVEPLLGTNPIAFGAPTDEPFPFIFDAATPIAQRGKIEVLARNGEEIPDGWVIDSKGRTVTSPAVAMASFEKRQASFLPLGGAGETLSGHKGFVLGTMVEILSASLQTGSFLTDLSGVDASGNPQPFRIGHYFLAINIENFTDLETFKLTTGNILRQLRNSNKEPGQSRIYTAGEKEFEKEKEVRAKGIKIIPKLQDDIVFLRDRLELSEIAFPF